MTRRSSNCHRADRVGPARDRLGKIRSPSNRIRRGDTVVGHMGGPCLSIPESHLVTTHRIGLSGHRDSGQWNGRRRPTFHRRDGGFSRHPWCWSPVELKRSEREFFVECVCQVQREVPFVAGFPIEVADDHSERRRRVRGLHVDRLGDVADTNAQNRSAVTVWATGSTPTAVGACSASCLDGSAFGSGSNRAR